MQFFATAVLLQGAPSAATPNDGASCTSLMETIALAAERSPDAAVAASGADVSRARLDAARGIRAPQVSAFTRSGIGDSGLVDSQIENQVGLQVSQRLFDFSKGRYQRESLAAEIDRDTALTDDARAEAAHRAALAYLDALRARRKLTIAQRERDYLADLGMRLAKLADAGGVTGAEEADAATQLADVDATIVSLQLLERTAALSVATALRTPQAAICEFERVAAEPIATDRMHAGVATLLENALADNPSMKASKSAVEAARAERDYQARQRLPDVDVVGIVSYSYDDFADEWGVRDRVGLNVSVPIFTGGTIAANTRAADALLRRARNEHEAASLRIAEDLNAAYQVWISSESQLAARRAAADAKAQQFNYAEQAHQGGFMTLRDLIEIRMQLTRQQMALADIEIDRIGQSLRVRFLSGEPLWLSE